MATVFGADTESPSVMARDPGGWLGSGRTLYRLGRLDEAMALHEEFVERFPDDERGPAALTLLVWPTLCQN